MSIIVFGQKRGSKISKSPQASFLSFPRLAWLARLKDLEGKFRTPYLFTIVVMHAKRVKTPYSYPYFSTNMRILFLSYQVLLCRLLSMRLSLTAIAASLTCIRILIKSEHRIKFFQCSLLALDGFGLSQMCHRSVQ